MARIPDSEIERVKRESLLLEIVRNSGVELKKVGDNYIGLCPFHDDHEPSLVVTPSKNLFHCLGCGVAGSAIDWAMRTQNISFRQAVELLRDQLVSPATSSQIPTPVATKVSCLLDGQAEKAVLLNQAITYYHNTLLESEAGLSYLTSRGLRNSELLTKFKLGFVDKSLLHSLPSTGTIAGTKIREKLQEIGIMRQTGFEHFNGCLVFPITDLNGNVTEIYGRKINQDRVHKDRPKHFYLKGEHRGVWNIEGIRGARQVVLCEALIDAATFWCQGITTVTASYGVEGFTPDHFNLFKMGGIERVYIAYDKDEAGERAAQALAKRLGEIGIECYRVHFPRGMDANEYAVQFPDQPLSELISSATLIEVELVQLSPFSLPIPMVEPIVEPEPVIPSPQPTPTVTMPITPSVTSSSIVASDDNEGLTVEIATDSDQITMQIEQRSYRIKGLKSNTSFDLLRANILARLIISSAKQPKFHVDTFDFYKASARNLFIKQTADELGVKHEIIKADIGAILLKLEQIQQDYLKGRLQPQVEYVMTPQERAEATELLISPNLIERILADFEACGVVGEQNNKLLGYLAGTSRKLNEPLAIIIQSSSAAGKSSLMDAILNFMPPEERVQYSALTGQALYYMEGNSLRHKILAIAEEQGVQRAAYALKLLQSEGELRIASTSKDPSSGNLQTKEYVVQGPVAIFITTTSIEIDEELLNRCIVLTVNEGRLQTQLIHYLQRERETEAGLWRSEDREKIAKLHQNAQRLLKPLAIVNSYANQLTFLDTQVRTRRDHTKYLSLIKVIALLHQYQRPIKTATRHNQTKEYLDVELSDIELANQLANEALGRSLDELPSQSRKLLLQIEEMVVKLCQEQQIERPDLRFSRRQILDYTQMGLSYLKKLIVPLEELEYLLIHSGRRGQSLVYELVYNGAGKDGKRFVMSLIDTEALKKSLNESLLLSNLVLKNGNKSLSSYPQVTAKSPTSYYPLTTVESIV